MKLSPLPSPVALEVNGKNVLFLFTREKFNEILTNKDHDDLSPIAGRVLENEESVNKTFKLGEIRTAYRDKIEKTFDQIQHD